MLPNTRFFKGNFKTVVVVWQRLVLPLACYSPLRLVSNSP